MEEVPQNVTQSVIVDILCERSAVPRRAISTLARAAIDLISWALWAGRTVELDGLGVFSVEKRWAQKSSQSSNRSVVKFKVSKKLLRGIRNLRVMERLEW
jgi:nucleoid DNA-binding protein